MALGPILIVEDHDMSRMVYQHLARLLNLNVHLVSTCKEACVAILERPFSLVIMDIGLPDVDGRECACILRKMLPESPPMLAITAYAMPGDKESVLASGIDDYLAKPFTIEQFEEKINSWLQREAEVSAEPKTALITEPLIENIETEQQQGDT